MAFSKPMGIDFNIRMYQKRFPYLLLMQDWGYKKQVIITLSYYYNLSVLWVDPIFLIAT